MAAHGIGAARAKIKRAQLRERDGDDCCMCGREMLFEKRMAPVPENYATLDHIVLRRDGGTNDIDNLRLVCQRCNWERDGQRNPTFPMEASR